MNSFTNPKVIRPHPWWQRTERQAICFLQHYRANSKWCLHCVLLFELLLPFAFEISGVHQHQLGQLVHHAPRDQVLDFAWETVVSGVRVRVAFKQDKISQFQTQTASIRKEGLCPHFTFPLFAHICGDSLLSKLYLHLFRVPSPTPCTV